MISSSRLSIYVIVLSPEYQWHCEFCWKWASFHLYLVESPHFYHSYEEDDVDSLNYHLVNRVDTQKQPLRLSFYPSDWSSGEPAGRVRTHDFVSTESPRGVSPLLPSDSTSGAQPKHALLWNLAHVWLLESVPQSFDKLPTLNSPFLELPRQLEHVKESTLGLLLTS